MLHTSKTYFCYVHLKKCIFYNLPRHFFLRVPMCGYSNVVSASVCAHGFILQPPFPPPFLTLPLWIRHPFFVLPNIDLLWSPSTVNFWVQAVTYFKKLNPVHHIKCRRFFPSCQSEGNEHYIRTFFTNLSTKSKPYSKMIQLENQGSDGLVLGDKNGGWVGGG